MATHYIECAHYRFCLWAGSNHSKGGVCREVGFFSCRGSFGFMDVERAPGKKIYKRKNDEKKFEPVTS